MKTKKINKEWFIETPWGKLAIVAWGEPTMAPVLLVHGLNDSAATFIPLVELMPDNYYYVAFDLPGCGFSDPIPGSSVTQIHLVEPMRLIVDHMKWKSFICIAHSIGYNISIFYNTLYPGKISKMVGLDPEWGLSYFITATDPFEWLRYMHSYIKMRYSSDKEFTYEEVITKVTKARGLTAEQGALILSRCLAPTTQGKYRVLWDRKVINLHMPFEVLSEVISTETPTLIISSSFSNTHTTKNTTELLNRLEKELKHFFIIKVEGTHNVHFSHPQQLVDRIVEFMKTIFDVKSKL